MKKVINAIVYILVWGVLAYIPAFAEEVTNDELTTRVKKLENRLEEGGWIDRIALSGTIEAEAGYINTDIADPEEKDMDESDVILATAVLGVYVEIVKHVSGHIVFLWEEDSTEPVNIDEGFITIDGKDVVPMYFNVGKLYVPFGNFASHMISDSLTVEIGETRESAVQVGIFNDILNLSVAAFNGDIGSTGDDDTISSYVGSVQFTLPESTIANFGLSVGASYISNIADSDGLSDEIATAEGTLEDHVAGLGAFISMSVMDMIFIEAEYIGATDEFEAGELFDDTDTEKRQPIAMNFELAVTLIDAIELAIRYEKTEDVTSLPETQYGAAIVYSLFSNTTIAVEYLHGEFEYDDETNVVTTQLAIEF